MSAEGVTWDVVELDAGEKIPPLDDYAALIVMGGPMDVWETEACPWLETEMAAIREWVADRRKPFLGVCLGHQLLAAALGGAVARADSSEVGVLPVTLTDDGARHPFLVGAPRQFECLQWHGAEVRHEPPGATVLAASKACAVQALAVGRHAFSIQFHVEVIDSTVDDWAAIPAYRESLEASAGRGGVERFRETAAAHMPAFNTLARLLYTNWRRTAFNRPADAG